MATPTIRIDTSGQIQGDHCRLKAKLQQLHEQLLAASLGPNQLERELLVLEGELLEHFAVEEEGGLFEQIVEAAPELAECVQVILRQHQVFRDNFRALCRTFRWACGASGTRDGWLAGFFEFHRQFDEHERAEHDLLHEALHRDIGTGD